jgi:hypothetical protein
MTDSRRTSLIDRFESSVSTDAIDCLSFDAIFSWIMILLQMIYADTTRIRAWFDVWFSSWLIQDNVIEIFLQMIDRDAQISTTTDFESFVSSQNSKSREVNIMSRSTIK